MKNILKNKKADFPGVILVLVIIFVLALFVIIFTKVFLDVTSELKQHESFSNKTIESIESVERKTAPLLDFLVFFVMVSLFIGLIISSFYIRTHPALIVVFIIMLIIAVLLAGQFTNIFDEVISKDELQPTAANFTLTKLILTDASGIPLFPVIIMVIGIVIVVVLYGKSKSDSFET